MKYYLQMKFCNIFSTSYQSHCLKYLVGNMITHMISLKKQTTRYHKWQYSSLQSAETIAPREKKAGREKEILTH